MLSVNYQEWFILRALFNLKFRRPDLTRIANGLPAIDSDEAGSISSRKDDSSGKYRFRYLDVATNRAQLSRIYYALIAFLFFCYSRNRRHILQGVSINGENRNLRSLYALFENETIERKPSCVGTHSISHIICNLAPCVFLYNRNNRSLNCQS